MQPQEIRAESHRRNRDCLHADSDLHEFVDNRFIGRARRAFHDIGVAGFGPEGEGGCAIGDEVEPE